MNFKANAAAMWILPNLYTTGFLTLIIILPMQTFVFALRDLHIEMPHAAQIGKKVTFKCLYDTEGDNLYSVRWYKENYEFIRFTPTELPTIKVFHISGLNVEKNESNETQLVLNTIERNTGGKFSCEVTADAPSFQTLVDSGQLEVVETPKKPPQISNIAQTYKIGDKLQSNCTSRHSTPAANLTWTINNEALNSKQLISYGPYRDNKSGLVTTISGVHLILTEDHFKSAKLKLRCTAQIYDIYWKSTEKIIINSHSDTFTQENDANAININMIHADELNEKRAHNNNNNNDNFFTQLQEYLLKVKKEQQHDNGSRFIANVASGTSDANDVRDAIDGSSRTMQTLQAVQLTFAILVLLFARLVV